jgi:hypothetical protein
MRTGVILGVPGSWVGIARLEAVNKERINLAVEPAHSAHGCSGLPVFQKVGSVGEKSLGLVIEGKLWGCGWHPKGRGNLSRNPNQEPEVALDEWRPSVRVPKSSFLSAWRGGIVWPPCRIAPSAGAP